MCGWVVEKLESNAKLNSKLRLKFKLMLELRLELRLAKVQKGRISAENQKVHN